MRRTASTAAIKEWINSWGDPITLYREVYVPPGKEPNLQNLGRYWTPIRKKAHSPYGSLDNPTWEPVVLVAKLKREHVDEFETIATLRRYGAGEAEIRPLQGAPLEVQGYYREGRFYPLRSRGKAAAERPDKEKDEIYKEWRELINMSPKELEDWSKNPDRLKASLNREEAKKEHGGIHSGYDSLHRIKRRVKKPRTEWTDEDYDNAAQENGFNSRMIGNDPGDPVGDTGRSKWEISLRNWGHSPSKKSSPAYSKWKSWKDKQMKGKKASASAVNPYVTKYMRILETPVKPKIRIQDNLGSQWLGQTIWSSRSPDTTTIILQKRILGDPTTLEKVVAHEMCHHAEFLSVPSGKVKTLPEHGPGFLALAAKINAVMGSKFVTVTSDQTYVESHTREYYLLVKSTPYRGDIRYVWAWGARLTPKIQRRVDTALSEGGKLLRVTDGQWLNGAKINSRGWSLSDPGSAQEAEIKRLLGIKEASHRQPGLRSGEDHMKTFKRSSGHKRVHTASPMRVVTRYLLAEYQDQIPGGLADKGPPKNLNIDELTKGIKIEMEHTDDPYVAMEIALDHLTEMSDYYTKLEKVEGKS